MSETVPVHPGLEALADGFFLLDVDRRIVYWNRAAARMLRVAHDRAIGRQPRQILPEPLGSALDAAAAEVTASGAPAEFIIPHLPGCCRGDYSVRATTAEGAHVAVHLRDSTGETKLAERYSQLLESIRDGFVAVDPDGKVSYINRVAERLLALPRDRALGRRVWGLIPPDAPAIEDCLRTTLADGLPRELRRVQTQGGGMRDRYVDLWVHPLPGGGLSVLFQDITRHVKRERELARYAAEAEEANRAKSRFFAAVSHELRTPLNAIVGYTHLLTTDTYGELPETANRAASRASVCAEHLAHLIDDLLLMTTAEIDRLPLTTGILAPAQYMAAVLEPVRQQAEAKGLRFRVDVEPGAPTIETDPDRVRQVLLAVLANAVKFTQRGEVMVGVHPLAVAPGAQDNGAPPDGREAGGLRIRIADTGPGIPPTARARIFEPFEQLGDAARSDSLRRGPGLGLSIARRLAKLLQGELSLERSDQSGSVFLIDLPLRLG